MQPAQIDLTAKLAHSPGEKAATGGSNNAAARVLRACESHLGRAVEFIAAILIAAEIVILFAGVVARYFLQQPLVWSDELASLLFLWHASLGAVVAFRRNEHMRMTALVGMTSSKTRAVLEAVSIAGVLAFLLLMLIPAYEFASEEIDVTTPALELSNAWRASALPVGLVLMAIVAIIQLFSMRSWALIGVGVGIVVLVAAALFALEPVLRGLGNLNLLLFFVGITGLLVFGGVPIAFCFGLATFGYLALTTRLPVVVLVGRMDEGMSHLILLAVPLFVFLGLLIEMTGME